MDSWKITVIYSFVIWATITDIRSRNISNRLVVIFLLLGILLHILDRTWVELILSFSIATVFSLLIYKLEMFGGGDLKLLIALSVFSSLDWTFGAFFYSLVSALPLFLFYMIKKKTWKPSIPYAVAILIGIIWQHIDPLIKG